MISSAATALAGDHHFIAIATPEHRAALRAGLPRAIMERAVAEGRFLEVDAGRTLAGFMREGLPDPELFDRTIGASVLSHAGGATAVQAWGEMVALLWKQGNVLGALRLEQLWNRLPHQVAFDMVCAYPFGHPDSESSAGFVEIRDLHERFTGVGETGAHRVG